MGNSTAVPAVAGWQWGFQIASATEPSKKSPEAASLPEEPHSCLPHWNCGQQG